MNFYVTRNRTFDKLKLCWKLRYVSSTKLHLLMMNRVRAITK